MRPLKSYLPIYPYNENKESDELLRVEQPEFDSFNEELKLCFSRQSILTADHIGIKLYENMLDIYANKNDTLEFRKERVILKLNSSPPFTLKYLRNCMDRIVGSNNYKVSMDYNAFTLHIEGTAKNENWFIEMTTLLARIKPANILYNYTTHPYDIINYYIGVVEAYIGRKKFYLPEIPYFQNKIYSGIVNCQIGKKRIGITFNDKTSFKSYIGLITRKIGRIEIQCLDKPTVNPIAKFEASVYTGVASLHAGKKIFNISFDDQSNTKIYTGIGSLKVGKVNINIPVVEKFTDNIYAGLITRKVGRIKIKNGDRVDLLPIPSFKPKIYTGVASLRTGKNKINIPFNEKFKRNIYTGLLTLKVGKITIGGIKND
ncbi:MAG: putative phage tail protein [Anaerovoracaceae bacterium]